MSSMEHCPLCDTACDDAIGHLMAPVKSGGHARTRDDAMASIARVKQLGEAQPAASEAFNYPGWILLRG